MFGSVDRDLGESRDVGLGCCFFFFFVKQNTAYEMLRSLVGSEMCIRDRPSGTPR